MEYVTWSDLIQYSILIVAIIALMHDISIITIINGNNRPELQT